MTWLHMARAAALLVVLCAFGASTVGYAATGLDKTAPAARGPVGARSTSIVGTAWRWDNAPVPIARLRLRNVLIGRIEATTVSNDAGQFVFTGIESGTYAIEIVSETGKVLAVGHTFTLAPGETVATFVRLGNKVPWFNAIFGKANSASDGFFSNVASVVSLAAASTGVTAIAPEGIRCVSPPCSR